MGGYDSPGDAELHTATGAEGSFALHTEVDEHCSIKVGRSDWITRAKCMYECFAVWI